MNLTDLKYKGISHVNEISNLLRSIDCDDKEINDVLNHYFFNISENIIHQIIEARNINELKNIYEFHMEDNIDDQGISWTHIINKIIDISKRIDPQNKYGILPNIFGEDSYNFFHLHCTIEEL